MITKKNKNKNKKTKKLRFTGKNIPESLIETKSNKYNIQDREKKLACYLANNDKVIQFASTIFYFILSYWKKYYPKTWKQIIGNELLEDIGKNNIINKIGFTIHERNEIFKFVDNNDKKELFAFLQNKFFKTTSTLNNLSKPDYSYYHVNVNVNLQNKFINNLKGLFLIHDITWKSFAIIYNNASKKLKKSYNFFIFDIIIYGNTSVNDLTLYKKNMTYLDFIKTNLPEDKKNNPKNLIKINKCNSSSISNPNYKDFKIYNAKNIYKIDKPSPYAKIMDKYGETYLSGPSGSTAIMFISLFQFYDFPRNEKNKIMLLCLIIADYIPLWHTLPEILLSANIELTSNNIPSYTLDKQPVNFVYNIIKPYFSY